MSDLFLHQAASISAQGFWPILGEQNALEKLENFAAQKANYKEVLPANMVRRMATITKMAVMCGLTVSKNNPDWDAIIAGTGLGNLADTERFLYTHNHSNGGLVPPTSFTQSSHNTLAGQIALLMKNHGYNMTHVQQDFSFFNSMVDAELQLKTGMNNVLVGAADEKIAFLEKAAQEWNLPEELIQQFGEGAAFFHLSNRKSEIKVAQQKMLADGDAAAALNHFLAEKNIDRSELFVAHSTALGANFDSADVDITTNFGRFFTNQALGLHVAANALLQNKKLRFAAAMHSSHLGKSCMILLERA